MPKVSTIKRLPPEVRELINGLFDRGRTLDEILAALRELDVVDVSRSSLHRYKQRMDKITERIRRTQALAEAAVRTLGTVPESKTARANIEVMHSILMEMMESIDPSGEDADKAAIDPMQGMLLAKALDHLAKAARNDAELTIKIREQVRKELEAEQRQKIDEAVETGGLDPAAAEEARRILGFA